MQGLITATAVAAVLVGWTGAAAAQTADVGANIYNQYCATCHGESGKGDGPLTELMMENVADLTQLSTNNDGVYPMLDVIHIIDGRTGVRGHGGAMPTYGDIFTAEATVTDGMAGDYSAVLAARGRVLSVAMYLESLQE